MDERHAYRLVRDLFDHKEAIFGELKRQSASLGGLGGPPPAVNANSRSRAVSSTDESQRRANMEARAKAISDRTREKSPAPTSRHRRDKSTDGIAGTRFPVVIHSVGSVGASRQTMDDTANRHSLEVPGTNHDILTGTTQPATNLATTQADGPRTNGDSRGAKGPKPGAFIGGGPGPHISPPDGSSLAQESASSGTRTGDAEMQDPLKSAQGSGGKGRRAFTPSGSSLSTRASLEGVRQGVTLIDRPMED